MLHNSHRDNLHLTQPTTYLIVILIRLLHNFHQDNLQLVQPIIQYVQPGLEDKWSHPRDLTCRPNQLCQRHLPTNHITLNTKSLE